MSQSPDNFDWDIAESSKGFMAGYSNEKRAELEKMYEGTLTEIAEIAGLNAAMSAACLILPDRA